MLVVMAAIKPILSKTDELNETVFLVTLYYV